MLIQEGACRIYLGVLPDVRQNRVKDLSNTVRVCTIEELYPSPCSGTVYLLSVCKFKCRGLVLLCNSLWTSL